MYTDHHRDPIIVLNVVASEDFWIWHFFFGLPVSLNDINIFAAVWYVQNVSTFPNIFVVVSPLICVFWIQLTLTNVVFSRIALVSCFCAEIQLSGKIPENTAKILLYQKTHGARVRDGEGPGGHHTTWWRGPGLAAPGGGVAAPAIASTSSFAYIYPLTWKYRGFGVFPK
jgi:hypothetical protein